MRNRSLSILLLLLMGAGIGFVQHYDDRGEILRALQALDTLGVADAEVEKHVLTLAARRFVNLDHLHAAFADAYAALGVLEASALTDPGSSLDLEALRSAIERKEAFALEFVTSQGALDAFDRLPEFDLTFEIESLRSSLQRMGSEAGRRAHWAAAVAVGLLGALGFAVQSLVGRLELSRDHERRMKVDLELEVRQRTQQLQASNLLLAEDIERRKLAESERDRMEMELQHAQKLEAVGRLAAGIAHEINTPTQYVSDNTHFLDEAFRELLGLVEASRSLVDEPDGDCAALRRQFAEADLEFLEREVPEAIAQSLEGLGRVSSIVNAMKEFSHVGGEKSPADLNRAIQSTVTVARNEWKYFAEVAFDLDDSLPLVPCIVGELNQVILNMLVNAAHAISEVVGDASNRKGLITVRTRQEGAEVIIEIEDDGCGMSEDVRRRIFDPFFTTKPVGRGSGQGLAIAHSVVYDKHGGTIAVSSQPGAGTRFEIRLPLELEPVPAV